MFGKHDKPSEFVLASKPSSVTSLSAGSATSAATSRSGGSKLLFGEIDTSSARSDSYASVFSFVLCDSSTFLKFWLDDTCRNTFLSFLSPRDLASLRLVGHDFSVRAAPMLFSDLTTTFKARNFTKASKLKALEQVGFFVKTLRFNLPHNADSFLPPLVDPETGAEVTFTYTPQTEVTPGQRSLKYGDAATTELVNRQYPPIFHAATNIDAFIGAFSSFVNLRHLSIACPGYDSTNRWRRSTVDFALISLRIAIERNCLNSLEELTLSPIHPNGLLYLAPVLGLGATPNSARRWSRIRHLTIHANLLQDHGDSSEPSQLSLLQTILRNYQSNLETFDFRWIGPKGPLPVKRAPKTVGFHGAHPAHQQPVHHRTPPPYYPLSSLPCEPPTTPPSSSSSASVSSSSSSSTLRPSTSSSSPPSSTTSSPARPSTSHASSPSSPSSLESLTRSRSLHNRPLHFPQLTRLKVRNVACTANEIAGFVGAHRGTLNDLDFDEIRLTAGTWDDALAPLEAMAAGRTGRTDTESKPRKEKKAPVGSGVGEGHVAVAPAPVAAASPTPALPTTNTAARAEAPRQNSRVKRETPYMADIPIMLSPTMLAAPIAAVFPMPMERVQFRPHEVAERRTPRLAKWLPGMGKPPPAPGHVRESPFKRVWRGLMRE